MTGYDRALARSLVRVTDDKMCERLRTLIAWETQGKLNLFGLGYGDMKDMPPETRKLMWYNTRGCWIEGAPLVIFQEHMYVFPSEKVFAEIALALEAGVGSDG